MIPACKPRWLVISVLLLLTAPLGAQKVRLLELQGQVRPEPQVRGESLKAFVRLSSVSEPYAANTWSDSKGRFKFSNLRPGTYNLYISHPKGSEEHKTIEVTPSFANARGIVTTTITLKGVDARASTFAQSTVGVRELSIPAAAHREFARANQQLKKRDLKGAIRHLEKSVALAPQYVEALNQLGTIYYQTRDYARAEQYFKEALAQDPAAFAPLVNLGGTMISLGRYVEALPINRRAVAAQADDALANSQLGMCYMAIGKYEEARTYLSKAKALDPGHFSLPQLSLAEIYLHEGLKQSALRELEDFVTRHPDSPLTDQVRERIAPLQSEK